MSSKMSSALVNNHNCSNEIDCLKHELAEENRSRDLMTQRYEELLREYDELLSISQKEQHHPKSKYDDMVENQLRVNDTLQRQVEEAEAKLNYLNKDLKNLHCCGRECQHCLTDLYIDYEGMSNHQLGREIKRLERKHMDMKSQMDRLQWRIDCESKDSDHLQEQLHRMEIELQHLEHVKAKRPCYS